MSARPSLNRPFGVKRFQTIHHYSVDVASLIGRLLALAAHVPTMLGVREYVEAGGLMS
jgi:hypothetical protein